MGTIKDATTEAPLKMQIDRIETLRDKIINGAEITEEDRTYFMGICQIEWPHDHMRAVRYLNDVIKEKKMEFARKRRQ